MSKAPSGFLKQLNTPAYTDALKLSNKLNAYAATFTKVNAMMVPQRLPVQLQPGMGVVSATDFEKVFWDSTRLIAAFQNANVDELALLQGIDFHEIGHVLFSPGPGTKLGDYIFDSDPGISNTEQHQTHKYIFNILEDQRMEMMLLALYPDFAAYLVAAISEFIINNDDSHAHAFMWGRKYFPKNIRDDYRQAYVSDWIVEDADTVARVIDEWSVLDIGNPKNYNAAMKLLNSLHFVPGTIQQPSLQCGIYVEVAANPNQNGGNGKGEGAQASPEDIAKAQGVVIEIVDGEGDGDPAEGEGGKKKGKGRKGISRTGTGDHAGRQEQLQNYVAQSLEAEGVQEIITGLRRQFNREVELSVGRLAAEQTTAIEQPVPLHIRQTSQHIADYLQELRHLLAPQWNRRQATGRVNIRKFYDKTPGDFDVFDSWSPGREEDASVETCILVDMSGSMSSEMVDVSQLLWLTKRSMDMVGIPTTAIGFDTRAFRLYGRDETVHPARYKLFSDMGGTDPTEALEQARKILLSSPAKHRLLITITDGGWSRQADCAHQVEDMTKAGVVTVLFGYSAYGNLLDNGETRGHSMGRNVQNLQGLPNFVRDNVCSIMKAVVYA